MDEKSNFIPVIRKVSISLMSITVLFAAVVIWLLTKPGTSIDLKRKMFYRHILYLLFYFLMIFNVISDLYTDEIFEKVFQFDEKTFLMVESSLYFLSGAPVSLLRLFEPYVLQELKNVMNRYLCCSKKKENTKIKYSKESLDSFLNSALNFEFVSIILFAVNKHMGELSALELNMTLEKMKSLREIDMNEVEVANWEELKCDP